MIDENSSEKAFNNLLNIIIETILFFNDQELRGLCPSRAHFLGIRVSCGKVPD
jgi:hypothetical protein